MKTLIELQTTFGARALELYTGVAGLRGGMHFEIRAVADGDGEFDLDFIGSDNSMDRYNEVIEPTAWGDMKNFRANPVIPDCHDYSSVAKILARAKSVAVVNGKLCNRCTFAMDNPLGAMAFKLAKGKFINSQSVGFIPEEWTNGNAAGQPDRTYTKCELLEISLVVVPANPGATVGLALKSGALQRSDVLAAAKFLGGLVGKEFSDSKPCSGGPGGASATGNEDARLLGMARSLNSVLNK